MPTSVNELWRSYEDSSNEFVLFIRIKTSGAMYTLKNHR